MNAFFFCGREGWRWGKASGDEGKGTEEKEGVDGDGWNRSETLKRERLSLLEMDLA